MLFGLALFVALAWSSHASLRELEAVTDARSRSRSGLLLAAEVMSALKDVETGQRGYVLTGDEHYLVPFETGTRSLDETFKALRRMLADRPQANLETLWTLIDRRVVLAESNIADRRAYAEEGSPWRQRLDEGRDTMDRIRARFAAIESMLRAEIEARDRSLEALRVRASIFNVLLPMSGVALILAAWSLLQRERRRRCSPRTPAWRTRSPSVLPSCSTRSARSRPSRTAWTAASRTSAGGSRARCMTSSGSSSRRSR